MKNQKAVVINADGEKSVVEFEFRKSYQLLSDTVGGMIECVGLGSSIVEKQRNADLWCNENGIAENLPLNLIASAIYSDAFNGNNPILGNVIITGGVDDEGETLGLTEKQVAYWLAYNKQVIPSGYLFSELYR
jgi:hypothetical protein